MAKGKDFKFTPPRALLFKRILKNAVKLIEKYLLKNNYQD